MEKPKKGKYKNHMLGCDSLKNKEKLETDEYDRNRLINQLHVHIDYLDHHGIRKYTEISKLLKRYQINRLNIQKFIEKFIEEINSHNYNEPISQMTKRESKKATLSDMNIIMNRCGLQYPIQFYDSFVTFVNENLSIFQFSVKPKQALFKSFKSKIDAILKKKEEIMNTDDNNNQNQAVSNANDNNTTLKGNENDTILKDHEKNSTENDNENNNALDCNENDIRLAYNEIDAFFKNFENNLELNDNQNISFLDENENSDFCDSFDDDTEMNDNYYFSYENDGF